MKIFNQAVAVCVVLAVSSTVLAQQAAQPAQQNHPAKPQVQTFEMVLGRAVETGGQNLARRAAQMASDIMPFPIGEVPIVNGIVVDNLGLYVFEVQVPGIGLTLQVMNMMFNRPEAVRPLPQGSRPVANEGGRVSADGLVASDSMSPPAGRLDFVAEYRVQVREALLDAILDNAGGLPMVPTNTLLVVASGIEPVSANSLFRAPSGKLVLQAKASDLAEFRQGRISREEAKQRIQVTRF